MSTYESYAADPTLSKLVRMYGADRTAALVRDTMREIGIDRFRTPEDRMRFGGALLKKGGLLEVIGRAIRVQAILQGARED